MGTVLSFSPKNNHYDENNGTVPSVKEEKSMKKHGIFLNGLSWKSFGHKNSAINHQTNNQYPTQQAFKGNKYYQGRQSGTKNPGAFRGRAQT